MMIHRQLRHLQPLHPNSWLINQSKKLLLRLQKPCRPPRQQPQPPLKHRAVKFRLPVQAVQAKMQQGKLGLEPPPPGLPQLAWFLVESLLGDLELPMRSGGGSRPQTALDHVKTAEEH